MGFIAYSEIGIYLNIGHDKLDLKIYVIYFIYV